MTTQQIILKLKALENKENIFFKQKKFGVIANNSLGIYHKQLAEIAKEVKKNSQLAIELFDTDIYEARILASKLFKVEDLTEELMEKWVKTFENWEICDSFCMGLFSKSQFAVSKINEWTQRENEFEKRAGFTIIASYCMADKKASNDVYEQFFDIIKQQSFDERLYVKKAVNWALRNIGKRNVDLHKKAIKIAQEILTYESKSAKWIAKDALKELQSSNVKCLDYPRAIYRKEL